MFKKSCHITVFIVFFLSGAVVTVIREMKNCRKLRPVLFQGKNKCHWAAVGSPSQAERMSPQLTPVNGQRFIGLSTDPRRGIKLNAELGWGIAAKWL